jgi:hypothetical protein
MVYIPPFGEFCQALAGRFGGKKGASYDIVKRKVVFFS